MVARRRRDHPQHPHEERMTTTDPALRPTSLDDYIGQADMKARLLVHMNAALASNRPMPHTFLAGPPGMGKTTLALLIAAYLGDPIVTITRPPTAREFEQILYQLNAGIVFIDEIHRLPKALQENALPLLQDGIYESGRYRYRFPGVTVIGATTEPEKVIVPLRDRFPVAPAFRPYGDSELARIVAGQAERAGSSIADDEETCTVLGRAAAGVPRHATELVVAARDLELAHGVAPTAEQVLAFCAIDPDGLGERHRMYLRCLAELGGRAGRDLLGARLGLHPSALTEVERLLLDRHLIGLEPTGRVLTGAGRLRAGGHDRPSRLARLTQETA
jgi:holliday junction DNA helicase RuvB